MRSDAGCDTSRCSTSLYFKTFSVTSPIATAAFFVSFVVILDATVVALIVEESYAMFLSILGTWLLFFQFL
jgi:hypothetical protein